MEGSEDDEISSSEKGGGHSYGAIAQDYDPVVLEMSSFDPGSSSSKGNNSLKLVF